MKPKLLLSNVAHIPAKNMKFGIKTKFKMSLLFPGMDEIL